MLNLNLLRTILQDESTRNINQLYRVKTLLLPKTIVDKNGPSEPLVLATLFAIYYNDIPNSAHSS